MTERNRAWRRRKSRAIIRKVKQTRDWLVEQMQNALPNGKTTKASKPAKAVKAAELRLQTSLNQQLAENPLSDVA
jgi:hypothetical protein